jgi:hypothetical protein
MTDRNEPTLSDEELDRRARELFAEVRSEHPEEKAGRALASAGDAAGEVILGLPDWLAEPAEGDTSDDGSGGE